MRPFIILWFYNAVFRAVFACVGGDQEIGFQEPRHRYKAFHHREQELSSMIYLYTLDRTLLCCFKLTAMLAKSFFKNS